MEFTMQLRKTASKTKLKTPKKQIKKRKNCRLNENKCFCNSFTISNFQFPQIWAELRQNCQLCDGIVRCEDGIEFKIHRAILSAASPYFRALFTNSINRGQPEIHKANVDIASDVFRVLLDYAYTGQCAISAKNVRNLLKYADRYEMLGVVQMCCNYLTEELTPNNCIGVWFFASQYFCRNLVKRIEFFLKFNFTQVFRESSEFLEILNHQDLIKILNDDELNVKSEELVFEAAIKWVCFKSNKRLDHLLDLLKCVRFGNLSNYFIRNILHSSVVRERQECKHFIEQTLGKIDVFTNNGTITIKNTLFRPRISYSVLFAIGGWSAGSPTNFVETYDVRADRWLLSSDTDSCPRAYHGLCVVHNIVYVIGGFDGSQYFNTVRRFDPVTHLWSECACMYHHRCYVSVAMCQDKIYAMGGFNGRVRMNSVERYDPERNQWEVIPPMMNLRSDASAAAINDKVYIVGGFNGQEVMRSVEVFDPRSNQWTYIPQMNSPRSGVSLIVYDQTIYALGGFDGSTRLTSGEKFVPGHSTWWSEISEMVMPRSNFASVILDDYIYVIGGFNDNFVAGSTTINYVEYYDPETNEWFDAASMNLNRSALSACVISGLPNVWEYSVLGMRKHKHNRNYVG